jgi:hypothetical protein
MKIIRPLSGVSSAVDRCTSCTTAVCFCISPYWRAGERNGLQLCPETIGKFFWQTTIKFVKYRSHKLHNGGAQHSETQACVAISSSSHPALPPPPSTKHARSGCPSLQLSDSPVHIAGPITAGIDPISTAPS